jgi:hypothetical protein
MNLHLIPDDKFLDDFIENIEAVDKPNNNIYLAYRSILPNKFKYIKSNKVILAPYKTKKFYNTIGNIKKYDKIFIHYLSDKMCEFINSLPDELPLYWIFWGGDFYSPSNYFSDFLYDKYSKKYINNKGKKKYIPNIILKQLLPFKNKQKLEIKRKAIEKLSYILHFNKYDYDLIKSTFNTKAKFLPFFYSVSEKMPELNSDCSELKEKFNLNADKIILLGNSGDPTNNHISVLNNIRTTNIKTDYKILCPLSYGSPEYIKYIIQKAGKLFGNKFIPLTEFLPQKKYYNLIGCTDITIMNHNRTQAAGNILISLFFGKKVFLKKENTLYKLYKDNGVTIFNIEDDLNNDDVFKELNIEEKEKNYQITQRMFSPEKARENIKKILE